MGLLRFGKSRRSDAWARASAPDLGEKDAGGKPEFNESFMSQGTLETMGVTVATDDSSDEGKGAARKIRSLQKRLRQKAVAMARLREAAEAGERVQSERIELLERQLELLVELPPSGRKRQGRALLSADKDGSSPHDDSRDDSQEGRRSQLEMSALQELLARVIAEKDRLGFENEHLRSMFKEGSRHSRVDKMPPSIVELDTRMIINEQEGKKENRREASPDLAPPAPLEELPLVLYKMTCRDRPQGQSRLRYMGNYTPTSSDSVKELTRRMKAHYSQVWRMVLEAKGDLSLIPPDADEEGDGDGFRTSALARHCVEHCLMQCLSSEDEVVRWCTDNVRVEIQKKERKSKSVPPGERKKKERRVQSTPPCDKERKAKSVPPPEKEGKERKAKSVPPREKEGRRRKKNRAGKSGKEDEKAKKGCSCEI